MRTKRCCSIVTGLILILILFVSSLLIPNLAIASTDKVKPTISGATNSVAYLNHSFDPRKGVTAKDNVDGNITSIIKISGKVNTKKLGKYTLTYIVTDSAKNTCTVKRVITVKKDTTKPKISGATNKTVYMGYSFNPKVGVKATDNAAGNLTSQIKVSGKVNVKKVGKYKLTYTVTDKAKNTSKITRTITVKKDTTKPKITGASNKTVYKGYSFNPKTGVKATDNVDGNITSKIKISGKINVNEVGIYKLKYTVEDKTKNKTTVTRTITVKKDTTKPKITGAIDTTIHYGDSFDPKKGVKATDNLDGTITSKMTISGSVNRYKIGTYKLTYTVKDKTGNTTSVTRTVKVVDKVAPTLSGNGLEDISINMGDNFNPLYQVNAADQVDGDLTADIRVEGEVNVDKAGIYTLTYTVKDKSGNISMVERKVKVVDNIAPTISGVDYIYLQRFDHFDPMNGVKASDNVDGDLTSKVKVDIGGFDTSDEERVGKFSEICYSVTDAAGNTTTISGYVFLNHRVAKFAGLDNVTINLGENFDPLEGVTATDEKTGEDITSSIIVENNVDINSIGSYKVFYSLPATKGYGTSIDRWVTVVDKNPPTITGVRDLTVNQGYYLDLLEGVAAVDDFAWDLTANIEIIGNVNFNKAGDYIVTYRVADSWGNIAEEHCTVTVKYVPVDKITIYTSHTNLNELSVNKGETFMLYTGISPEYASVKSVTWTSSDESIATINQDGWVTTKKRGTVTFTATGDGGVTGNLTMKVLDIPNLQFDEYGYDAGIKSLVFRIVSYDKDPIDVEAVQVYDKYWSLIQTYSSEQLKDMGVKTSILPLETKYMCINVGLIGPSIADGGKVVVFASPGDGNTYEFEHIFPDL